MKTQTSSKRKKSPAKKKPQTRNIKLADGTIVKADDNTKRNVQRGKVVKHDLPKKPFSTESGRDYEDYEVNDDFDKLTYPPPSKHPEFRKFWAAAHDNLVGRSNFNEAHLGVLETYCRLLVQLRKLDRFVEENGYTYRTTSVAGEYRKTHPEVSHRIEVVAKVAKFATLLDLLPKKDKSLGNPSGGGKEEDDDWT